MLFKYIFLGIAIFISNFVINNSSNKDCVSVPPGGISGFWYSISKLKSIEKKHYYCASSGCLAIVSSSINLRSVYNFALSSKKLNDLKSIKNNFIDLIVKEIKTIPNVTIITMSMYGTCIERVPKNKKELKTLLIKTTDIPILVKNLHGEIDGGICYHYINPCKTRINIPLDYKFIKNLFNHNISNKDLEYFYNYK